MMLMMMMMMMIFITVNFDYVAVLIIKQTFIHSYIHTYHLLLQYYYETKITKLCLYKYCNTVE